jgi:hypothetical protein
MKFVLFSFLLGASALAATTEPKLIDCTRNYLAVDGSKTSIVIERNQPGQNSWTVTASFVTGGLRPRPSPVPDKGTTVLAKAATCTITAEKPLQVKCEDRAASPNFTLVTALTQSRVGKFVRVTITGSAIDDLAQKNVLEYYGLHLNAGVVGASQNFAQVPPSSPSLRDSCQVQ